MSVLIKGMQMPKCCRECDAEGHYDNSYGDEYGFFCPFGYKAYTSETRELKRLDDCPLVPVPPHGRWNNIIQGIIPSGQCSNCGAWDKVTRFCPNCGSQMEGAT